jgi:hypothetical protein
MNNKISTIGTRIKYNPNWFYMQVKFWANYSNKIYLFLSSLFICKLETSSCYSRPFEAFDITRHMLLIPFDGACFLTCHEQGSSICNKWWEDLQRFGAS